MYRMYTYYIVMHNGVSLCVYVCVCAYFVGVFFVYEFLCVRILCNIRIFCLCIFVCAYFCVYVFFVCV